MQYKTTTLSILIATAFAGSAALAQSASTDGSNLPSANGTAARGYSSGNTAYPSNTPAGDLPYGTSTSGTSSAQPQSTPMGSDSSYSDAYSSWNTANQPGVEHGTGDAPMPENIGHPQR